MSQPGKRKNKSLLDFYSKKSRDDSTESVTVCRDVKAASSVSAELACSSSNDKHKLPDSFTEEFQSSNQQPLSSSALKSPANDISFCVGKTCSNAEKLRMLKNVWTPDPPFDFPFSVMGKRTLRFQYRWLNRFKWLAYSKVEDGAFCRFCALEIKQVLALETNQLELCV